VPARYRNVLFICHANTSRSIMAEAMLKKMLRDRDLYDQLVVRSGGVAPYARDGALVSLDTRFALRDEGIHLPSDSVATDLKTNRHLIGEADLILAMTAEQIRILRGEFPEATGKEIHTLKDFAGIGGDIADPAGCDPHVFASTREQIKVCLQRTLDRLVELAR
jgi:protein-tyrosine-phosphatase